MSRWNNNFENHAFRENWQNLKEISEEITIDDETVTTTVAEVARFKKVVSYLDELIENLDPELIPLSTWDSFNQQASNCLTQVRNYASNRNVSHMNSANNHADNLLTYVRPYMVLPKAAQASIKRAATAYAKVAEDYVETFQEKASTVINDIEKSKKQCSSNENHTSQYLKEVNEYYDEIFGDEDDVGIKVEIEKFKTSSEEKFNAILKMHEKIFTADDALSTEIDEAYSDIIDNKEKISKARQKIEEEIADFKKFHITTFGKIDEESGENKGGTKQALAALEKNLEDFETKQHDRYKALNEQIESLLPGATSAGLAEAYNKMKTSFDEPIKKASRLFYACIAVLVAASFVMATESISWGAISFKNISDWQTVLMSLVYKLPLFAPIVWLTYFASKRRSEAQRLQQEYAHKESLSRSYKGYKQQLEELGDDDGEMRKALITKTIESIAHNASKTLDGKHGDEMPTQKMVESIAKEVGKINFSKIYTP